MTRICIVAAKRTPQGRFLGSLSKCSAVELAIAAGRATMESAGKAAAVAGTVDRVIVGNVLSAGLGMTIARQIGVGVGVPIQRPAFTVNMMCASGMQAFILAAQSIATGESSVVLCGGTEAMSQAPYLSDRARAGHRLGHGKLTDVVLRDGLVDPFDNEHMGLAAERLAEKFSINRQAQDAFALDSQRKAARAIGEGRFDAEMIALDNLDHDEHPRPDTTLEQLASLRPAFKTDGGGTVTAGNASGINDGSSMMLLCDESAAEKHGWQPLAVLTGYASVGCDPKLVGMGPIHSTNALYERFNCNRGDFDLIEINEAFAVQTLTCIQELKLDPALVNIDGGAIALGHPIGASGARIIVHLAHQLSQGKARRAMATLCAGGGMGATVALEAV